MVSVESNLRFLVGHSIRAIDRGDSNALQRYLERYQTIVSEFTKKTSYEESFNHDTATQIARSLRNDSQLLIAQSLQAPTQNFPYRVLQNQRAILSGARSEANLIIAQNFADSFADSYEIAVRTGEAIQPFVDNLMRSFSQVINHIPQTVANTESERKLAALDEVVEAFLQSYWKIFLHAVNYEDDYLFDICWEGFEFSTTGIPRSENIDFNRRLREEDNEDMIPDRRFIENFELAESRRSIIDSLTETIDVYRFAAGAWAFHQYRDNEIADGFFDERLTNVIFPYYNIENLSKVYFSLSLEDDFALNVPRRENISPTQQSFTFSSSIQSWLLDFYAFLGPLVLSEDDIDTILQEGETPIPSQADVTHRQNRLGNRVRSFSDDGIYNSWMDRFQINSIENRIEAFISAHEIAVESHRAEEFEEIRGSSIEAEQERGFKQDAVETFESDFDLRNAVNEIGGLQRVESEEHLTQVSHLEAVPKSRFTTFQSFHMSYDPQVRPLIAKATRQFVEGLDPIQRQVAQEDDLPTRIAASVSELDDSGMGLIVANPGPKLGDYLNIEGFERPRDEFDHPIGGVIFYEGIPILMDPSLQQAGYSAVILQDIESIRWFELFKEGSPIRIDIVDERGEKVALLDRYGITNVNFDEGQPITAVEYTYPFDVDFGAAEGAVLTQLTE